MRRGLAAQRRVTRAREAQSRAFFSLTPDLDLRAARRELMKGGDAEVVARTDVMLHVRLGGADVDVVRYDYASLTPPRKLRADIEKWVAGSRVIKGS